MNTDFEAFLDELAHQRRASLHTVAAYRRDLKTLQSLAADASPLTLQPHQLRRFAMQLHGKGLAARSLARALSSWRAWYRWLARRGEIARNPCDGLRAPRRAWALPRALSVDQTQALLDAAAASVLDFRDKAMFELFYSSGLRLAELASLDCGGGLDLAEGVVTVTGKRDKTRTVPLGAKAAESIRAWLERRPGLAAADEPALFVGRRGSRLGVRAIERRLESWAQRQGLGVHVHPHMLRHSFASHVLQSSGDLRAVQEMLGHASIGSTQIYTHLDFQHLAKVYDVAHPRAKKVPIRE
ncbi:MAG: tyrosine recombinase XerC [Candidatus Nitricoxidivorans perseverans]|uniref:Tyrosine recombinase XerC n=1 Tax=Candidatus Nitricoxidivorans perseverans TaxID=2975601 RepID=A0AA49FKD3_9PROT|nr:MAG: tyrosine recombinase XerC [Candidatus Nitricoxidivorans perseverans]